MALTDAEFRLEALRTHRHDVLNALQLIRAYIQLQRPDAAVKVIDRTATWLQSFALWQSKIRTPHPEELLLVTSMCSRIWLAESQTGMEVFPDETGAVIRTLQDLNEWATLNEQYFGISLHRRSEREQRNSKEAIETDLVIVIYPDKETHIEWTSPTDYPIDVYLHQDFAEYLF